MGSVESIVGKGENADKGLNKNVLVYNQTGKWTNLCLKDHCTSFRLKLKNNNDKKKKDELPKHRDIFFTTNFSIRIISVNSTNQASDVCRRTTSGSDNNNPHSNVNNNMTTSNVFDFKQYEVDKMYSPQCKRETLYCYNNARSIKLHSPNF